MRGLRGWEGGGWNFPQKAFRLPVRTAQWGPAGERGKVRDRQRDGEKDKERYAGDGEGSTVRIHTHTHRCSAYVYTGMVRSAPAAPSAARVRGSPPASWAQVRHRTSPATAPCTSMIPAEREGARRDNPRASLWATATATAKAGRPTESFFWWFVAFGTVIERERERKGERERRREGKGGRKKSDATLRSCGKE